MRRFGAWCRTHGSRPKPLRCVSGARRPDVQSRQASGRISTRKNSLSRPGEGQEGGREHSPSSLTPVTVREAERSYPRRGYRFLPKGKYRSFTVFFPQREIPGLSPCFSFPAKADEKGTKDRFFPAGFFCGPHIFYAPAVIAAGGRPHGGRGSSPHPPASIRHTIRKKNEGKQCRPPVSQPPNRTSRIHTGARQSPDEKGRPENKPIRLPSGHHPLSARHPRHQSPPAGTNPAGANRCRFVHCKAFCRAWLDL